MINLDVPEKERATFPESIPDNQQEEMIGRLVSLKAFAGSGQWEDLGLDVPQPDNLDKAKMLVATNVARKNGSWYALVGLQVQGWCR